MDEALSARQQTELLWLSHLLLNVRLLCRLLGHQTDRLLHALVNLTAT